MVWIFSWDLPFDDEDQTIVVSWFWKLFGIWRISHPLDFTMPVLTLAANLAGFHPPDLRSWSASTLVTFQVRTFWFLNRFWPFLVRWKALDLYFLKHSKSSKSVQKWQSSGPKRMLLWHPRISVPGGWAGWHPANLAARQSKGQVLLVSLQRFWDPTDRKTYVISSYQRQTSFYCRLFMRSAVQIGATIHSCTKNR